MNRIGAYEILGLLGSGATATVYECRHEKLGRRAALKVLHPHLARDATAAARFLREGRAVSRIVHPNVVEVFDVGEHEDLPFLVMSLVQGEDLAEHLRRAAPLSVVDAVDRILPVVAAVAAAHDAGIIHRDLKPSNIRITRDHLGRLVPKVLDFGISKLTEDDQPVELTHTDGTLGTAGYMAPEQLRSAKHVDSRCDVYSLGVILYECVTGRRPFVGSSGYELMHAVLTEPLKPPSAVGPGIAAEFDAVVMLAMRREPAERFSSARAFALALAPFASDPEKWVGELETPGESAPKPVSSGSRMQEPSFTLISASSPKTKKGKIGAPAFLAAALSCLALAGMLAIRAGRAAPSAPSAVPAEPAGSPGFAMENEAAQNGTLTRAVTQEMVAAPADASSGALAKKSQVPRAPSAPRMGATIQPPPAPSRAVPSRPERGTNGVPILE